MATMAGMTSTTRRRQWQQAMGGLFLLIAVIVWVFWESAASMASIWYHSPTFNHGFLIPLISIWLIWNRRDALMAIAPRGSIFGLLGMLGSGLLWLTGTLGSVQVVQHFGLVFMIQSAILAVWGWPAVRSVFFAVAYLLFAVPFGEFRTGHLQDFTATFVVQSLRLMNIPVYSNGIFISIPNGNFEVAEACAGVRFLIATVAIGTLFSYLSYRSWARKLTFVALSFIIPVIANGFRALGILLIAYYSNNKYAVGADHIVYGWGFFAFVLLLLLYIGSRFSDKPVGFEDIRVVPDDERTGPGYAILIYSAIGLVITALGPAYAQYVTLRSANARIAPMLPQTVGDWTALADGDNPLRWHPLFNGNSREVLQAYRDGAGRLVEVYATVYDSQLQGQELISHSNALAAGDARWQRATSGTVSLGAAGATAYQRITNLRDVANVYYWYWVDDQFVTSDMRAKALYVKAALTGGNPASGLLAIAIPNAVSDAVTEATARDFAGALLPLAARFADTPGGAAD
jgi:exosortase A